MNTVLQYVCLWLFGFFGLLGFFFPLAWLGAAMALGIGIGLAQVAPTEDSEA